MYMSIEGIVGISKIAKKVGFTAPFPRLDVEVVEETPMYLPSQPPIGLFVFGHCERGRAGCRGGSRVDWSLVILLDLAQRICTI